MSLYILNEGRELDADYREHIDASLAPARVMNAARVLHGEKILKPLFDAFGTRIHRGKMADFGVAMTQALAEIELPAELMNYATSSELDEELRASHLQGISLVGGDVGSPIVAVEDVAFFGPVLSPAPVGEDAGRLWDGCVLVAKTPGFYEMKRTRNVDPIFE